MKTATWKQRELDEMDIFALEQLYRGYCFKPEAGGFSHEITPEERKKISATLKRRLGDKRPFEEDRMNSEVYLRARLADEENRLEPDMKTAIEWALKEIEEWRGMWDVANNRANELRRKEYEVRALTGAMRHVQLICDNATALSNRLNDSSAIALNLVLAINRIDTTITKEIGERWKKGDKINAD